jgi:hypothetical protein
VLALDRVKNRQHLRIQHLPGADLLLDHVEASLFHIHRHRSHSIPHRNSNISAI